TVQLHLAADVLDDGHGFLHRRAVGREHRDASVVLDVDLGARLLLDAADDLAAGADDLADLLGADLDGHEPRRVRRELRARLLERFTHLRQHDHASLACVLQRRAHHVDGHALDLDVHLQRGDALLGAGALDVHAAAAVVGAPDAGDDPAATAL